MGHKKEIVKTEGKVDLGKMVKKVATPEEKLKNKYKGKIPFSVMMGLAVKSKPEDKKKGKKK